MWSEVVDFTPRKLRRWPAGSCINLRSVMRNSFPPLLGKRCASIISYSDADHERVWYLCIRGLHFSSSIEYLIKCDPLGQLLLIPVTIDLVSSSQRSSLT